MGSTYHPAGEEVRQMAFNLITDFHQELAEAKVKIDYVFAFAELDDDTSEKLGPAIKHNGIPALGLASKIGLKDRAKGMGDCEILLDGDAWKLMTDTEKKALLDHELEHFEIKRDKFGGIKTDDLDRPMIKMRPHDREHGWFDNIARRWGIDSQEAQQFRAIFAEAAGSYAPHIRLPAPEDAPSETRVRVDAFNQHVAELAANQERGQLLLPTGRPRLVPKDEAIAVELETEFVDTGEGEA